ncbi:MAG: hypothetical protein ACRCVT_02830 [Leadbetterella sp.]
MFVSKKVSFIIVLCFMLQKSYCQIPSETKISSYIGIVHPLYTVQKAEVTPNFRDYYQMGITTAVIIKKAKRYAYNLEIVGFIRHEKGITKMNNLMLHPGVSFIFKKDWIVTPRLGFETSGRFGPTLIITKTMAKPKGHPINFNLVNLVRFGNDTGASFTQAINLTFGF